jgi:hypothetical protein
MKRYLSKIDEEYVINWDYIKYKVDELKNIEEKSVKESNSSSPDEKNESEKSQSLVLLTKEKDWVFNPNLILSLFDTELLKKCIFIYFLLFERPNDYITSYKLDSISVSINKTNEVRPSKNKDIEESKETFLFKKENHKEQVKNFCNILNLSHYIFYNKYFDDIKINEKIYIVCDKIYKNNLEYNIGIILYSFVKKNLNSYKEIEFISFTYFFTKLLLIMKFKIDDYIRFETLETKLKDRLKDYIDKLSTKKRTKYIHNIDHLFKKPLDTSIYTHINGNFESGIPNIFYNTVPKNLSEEELYSLIKKMKKDLNY